MPGALGEVLEHCSLSQSIARLPVISVMDPMIVVNRYSILSAPKTIPSSESRAAGLFSLCIFYPPISLE